MLLIFVIALIGDPPLVAGGIAVGLLARRRLHLLAAALVPALGLLSFGTANLSTYIAPALIVAFIWAVAAYLVKLAVRAT